MISFRGLALRTKKVNGDKIARHNVIAKAYFVKKSYLKLKKFVHVQKMYIYANNQSNSPKSPTLQKQGNKSHIRAITLKLI